MLELEDAPHSARRGSFLVLRTPSGGTWRCHPRVAPDAACPVQSGTTSTQGGRGSVMRMGCGFYSRQLQGCRLRRKPPRKTEPPELRLKPRPQQRPRRPAQRHGRPRNGWRQTWSALLQIPTIHAYAYTCSGTLVKAAQRTENLRRKRLRADGKAGAARSEEEAGRPLVPRGITRMVTDAARPLPHGATCAQRGTGSGRQMRRGSVTDCLQRTPAARKPRLRPTQ